jgi:thiamine transport system substrate-binding protein
MKVRTAALAAMLVFSACSSSTTSTAKTGETITLITHDSFAVTDGLLEKFTASSGIKVNVAKGADAGVMLNQAILTKGKPEGDVIWGIDNTLLSRAIRNGVLAPYAPSAAALSGVDAEALKLVPNHEATPVDRSDVCVNIDKEWFATNGKTPPANIEALIAPEYKNLTVVENPATSSTGLAFLLATVAKYGDKWPEFWKQMKANGALVVDGWTAAYQTEFSHAKGGKRPIVVSYGSSPAAEVPASGGPSPTAALFDACFRQVEFVGVLKGSKHQSAAHKLIEFMLSDEFQLDMPPNMYVYPIKPALKVPDAFSTAGGVADKPLAVEPARIEAERDAWIKAWSAIMTA